MKWIKCSVRQGKSLLWCLQCLGILQNNKIKPPPLNIYGCFSPSSMFEFHLFGRTLRFRSQLEWCVRWLTIVKYKTMNFITYVLDCNDSADLNFVTIMTVYRWPSHSPLFWFILTTCLLYSVIFTCLTLDKKQIYVLLCANKSKCILTTQDR